ncbi:murein biosynthesis integral membrane protein MurJ [Roseococcus sp. SDR]|uniref:murein biosynthesis integral membrane protein MurJ n=1 Tax=Roseococcus sp. SDR TaxID=2835532 RepID=UPI001BCD4C77|nr:murein biosynthesis integral membrane protein MurJ [Roseococcus sp. SDR]MBS7792984.1 murein biosynthesis integral membrane protein MurJ [Roseococcus sp. SDR]MBV1848298.1 murein biosynthesis integral membrane protein MurJ [Roseococcus sp. SDR]
MFRAIATVGGWTMVSRLLGFLRDMLIAARLGAGPMADAFFVALKLPNLFRRLFGEGAFNAAFVPAFAQLLTQRGPAAAQALAERMATLMVLWLALLTGLGLIFMPQFLAVLAPGFGDRPEVFALAVELTRITFPYLLLICLTALVSGVLNALGKFAAAAAAPIFFNLLSMIALFALAPFVATPAHALAWGVTLSGVVQLGFVWWACARAGMALNPVQRPSMAPEVRQVLRRMGPGLVGAGVTQLNLAIDVIIASFLPAGAVSFLYYADRVAQLPLGVIGAAVATALLPLLARQIHAGQPLSAHRSLNRAVEIALVLAVPAAVALAALALPILSALFQRGAFGPAEARATSQALMAYALGLPAFVLVKVFVPGFFARGDTATPVKIGIGCVALNLALNLVLMGPLQHVGVALSTTLAAWANAGLLAFVLHRRGHWVADRRLRRTAPRLLGAALAMGAALLALAAWLAPGAGLSGMLWLGVICGLGAGAYFGLAQLSGGLDLREIRRLIRRKT